MSSVKHFLTDHKSYNVNDNVDRIANRLTEKFNSPQSHAFYCKVAWRLTEAQIWSNYEKAQTGRNPAALFNWLCRKDMI